MTNLEKFDELTALIREKLTCFDHGCIRCREYEGCPLYNDPRGCTEIAREAAIKIVAMFEQEQADYIAFGQKEYKP